ncbi:hypothetical protein C8J56DRAFT_884102 [Mycena floridula]|nr:hypothetical protein C8J56DRAFT_884102 [Mycena floridula]
MKRKLDRSEDCSEKRRPASLQTTIQEPRKSRISLQTRALTGPGIRSPEKEQRTLQRWSQKPLASIRTAETAEKPSLGRVSHSKTSDGDQGDRFESVANFLGDIGAVENGETAAMGVGQETGQESSNDNVTELEDEPIDDEEGDGDSFAEASELYASAVSSNAVGFFQVGERLCVIEGWDRVKATGTDRWFHLTVQNINGELVFGCQCVGFITGRPPGYLLGTRTLTRRNPSLDPSRQTRPHYPPRVLNPITGSTRPIKSRVMLLKVDSTVHRVFKKVKS